MLQGSIYPLHALPARPGEDGPAPQPGCGHLIPSPSRDQPAAVSGVSLGGFWCPARGLEGWLAMGLLPNTPQAPGEEVTFRQQLAKSAVEPFQLRSVGALRCAVGIFPSYFRRTATT